MRSVVVTAHQSEVSQTIRLRLRLDATSSFMHVERHRLANCPGSQICSAWLSRQSLGQEVVAVVMLSWTAFEVAGAEVTALRRLLTSKQRDILGAEEVS